MLWIEIFDDCFWCRLYDKGGDGYITTAVLKEILGALDDNLTSRDLDGIIEEIDTDGSGTVDFDGRAFLKIFLVDVNFNSTLNLQNSWR